MKKIAPFIFWPIAVAAASFAFSLNYFWSIVLFLGVPAAYLTILMPKISPKVLVFSACVATPAIIIIDYIAYFTKQWIVPHPTLLKIFSLIPLDDVIWAVIFAYFAVMFYEYFVDRHQERKIWHSRMTFITSVVWLLFLVFVILYFFYPALLRIPYAYLFIGIFFMLIPSLIELARRPRLLPKFLVTASYFFFLAFIYEVTALSIGWWTFPGTQYIGWISLGNISFPFEEFFFGFIFYSLTSLTFYEAFDDDEV